MSVSAYEEAERCARSGCVQGLEEVIRHALDERSFFRRRALATLALLGIMVAAA